MTDQKELREADKGFVGETFETKNYGRLKVLRRSGMGPNSTARYEVEFVETGHRAETYKSNIKKGDSRHPSQKNSVVGLGSL